MRDPQFSSPPSQRAQDRIDDDGDRLAPPSIDPALLQAVLADPVLLQAVDPHVLQAVLVQAATANLELELDTARTSQWMCDVTIRTRGDMDTPGMWQELTCHSSVLAAVSPVLRHALADLDHLLEPGDGPGVVIISELSMADLLPLFYSGQVSRHGHSLKFCRQRGEA